MAVALPHVEVVERGISVEDIAIAVPIADQGLLRHITAAQEELDQSGMLQQIRRKWLGYGALEQSVAMR
jgi:polar amino acid transport system substrate-binding protein